MTRHLVRAAGSEVAVCTGNPVNLRFASVTTAWDRTTCKHCRAAVYAVMGSTKKEPTAADIAAAKSEPRVHRCPAKQPRRAGNRAR